MKVISERPVSLPEVKMILEKLGEKHELSYIEKRILNLLNNLPILDFEVAKNLLEDLKSLELKELDERILIKIIDICPRTNDDLRAILYGTVLDKDKAEKILETVKKYLEK